VPLDPTIPLQAAQSQQASPLQQLGQTATVLNGLQTLKKNQLQLGANQAISDAYSQSLNPDGSVDFNKLQSLAGQNGAGAYLPEFMAQIAQQRNSQQQYDTSKLDMALKQQQNIRGMIGSLALDPDIGKADMSTKIAGQISDAVRSGLLPLERGVQEIQGIPSDPSQQKAWITNHLVNSLSGEAKIQAMMPQNVAVDTGSGTVLLNRNPLTGESTVGTTVQKGLSPQDLAQTMNIVGPNGEQRSITKAQYLQMQGGGGVPGAPAGGAPSGYTGRNDGSGQGAPGVQTSLGPAQQAALTAQGGTSNAAMQSLHDEAKDAPMRINLLQTARDALDNNGNPLDTGPNADWRNTAKSFVNSLAPGVAKSLGVTGDVKNFDEFKKIMTNYASAVSGSLGSGTDARLNAAVTGNANVGISNMANQDILTKTMAAEKMRAAQDYAFQQSGLTSDQFNKWQSQWNKAVNPDAFVFSEMSPTQQQAFIKRQSPAQLTKFKSDLGNLVRQGIITMPGQ
jgi:hypothetical protein